MKTKLIWPITVFSIVALLVVGAISSPGGASAFNDLGNTTANDLDVKISLSSNDLYLPLVLSDYPLYIINELYLPLVLRDHPLNTIFGVELRRITDSRGLSKMSQAGSSWVRRNGVLWSQIEPERTSPPTYNWSVLDNLETELINAANNHMEVILIVRGTPTWAQKVAGKACGPIQQEDFSAFADFMAELVTRYSFSPYSVKYWEIWNEPDVDSGFLPGDYPFGCWGDDSDDYYGGGYYGEMLKVVYPKVKAANSDAQIIVGGLLLDRDPRINEIGDPPKPPMFLEGILRADAGSSFDGVAFHAYDYYYYQLGKYGNLNWNSGWSSTGPVSAAKVQFINEVLSKYDVSGKFIMNTESALLCGKMGDPAGGTGCEPDDDSPFEITKAYYVAQSYAIAIAEGLQANIWYNPQGWRNTSLLNADLTPRLGYTAFKVARNTLRDATYSKKIDTYHNLMGYEFTLDGDRIWVIWSLTESGQTIALPEPPSAIKDVFGVSQSVAGSSLTVTAKPLYIDW